jgi:hypothetical protein
MKYFRIVQGCDLLNMHEKICPVSFHCFYYFIAFPARVAFFYWKDIWLIVYLVTGRRTITDVYRFQLHILHQIPWIFCCF